MIFAEKVIRQSRSGAGCGNAGGGACAGNPFKQTKYFFFFFKLRRIMMLFCRRPSGTASTTTPTTMPRFLLRDCSTKLTLTNLSSWQPPVTTELAGWSRLTICSRPEEQDPQPPGSCLLDVQLTSRKMLRRNRFSEDLEPNRERRSRWRTWRNALERGRHLLFKY